jgi:mono/diheme cytochrome c family protein
MSHRIVGAVIAFLLVLFGAGGLLFAVAMTPAPAAGDGALPATHRSFDAGTCASCHPAGQGPQSPN